MWPPGIYYFFEERYARRAALFRRLTMGLLIFTMMMKTVRITKSLVKEIRTFCMRLKKQGPYQPLVAAVELLCRQLRLDC